MSVVWKKSAVVWESCQLTWTPACSLLDKAVGDMLAGADGYWSADVVKADSKKPKMSKGKAKGGNDPQRKNIKNTPSKAGIKVGKKGGKKIAKDPALLKAQQKARDMRKARGGQVSDETRNSTFSRLSCFS